MLTLTIQKVEPFLAPLTPAQKTRVTTWLPVLQLLLNGRYGDKITTEPDGGNEIAFVSAAADALNRRLMKPAGLIDAQTIGPANVKYNSRANLSTWFLPEELTQLDGIVGIGSIRSVRTPAPDGIRFGNRMRDPEGVDF